MSHIEEAFKCAICVYEWLWADRKQNILREGWRRQFCFLLHVVIKASELLSTVEPCLKFWLSVLMGRVMLYSLGVSKQAKDKGLIVVDTKQRTPVCCCNNHPKYWPGDQSVHVGMMSYFLSIGKLFRKLNHDQHSLY